MNNNLPTFPDICRSHKVDPSLLMRQADVSSAVVDQMSYSVDHPVSRVDAEKVLGALSKLTEQNYTLESVYVPLTVSAHDVHSEVAQVMRSIALETEASQRGLYGLAETAQHERLKKHTENMAQQVIALHKKGGDEAVHLLFDQWSNEEVHNSSAV